MGKTKKYRIEPMGNLNGENNKKKYETIEKQSVIQIKHNHLKIRKHLKINEQKNKQKDGNTENDPEFTLRIKQK